MIEPKFIMEARILKYDRLAVPNHDPVAQWKSHYRLRINYQWSHWIKNRRLITKIQYQDELHQNQLSHLSSQVHPLTYILLGVGSGEIPEWADKNDWWRVHKEEQLELLDRMNKRRCV